MVSHASLKLEKVDNIFDNKIGVLKSTLRERSTLNIISTQRIEMRACQQCTRFVHFATALAFVFTVA